MADNNQFNVDEAEKAPPIRRSAIPLFKPRLPGMAGWLISKGLVKDDERGGDGSALLLS